MRVTYFPVGAPTLWQVAQDVAYPVYQFYSHLHLANLNKKYPLADGSAWLSDWVIRIIVERRNAFISTARLSPGLLRSEVWFGELLRRLCALVTMKWRIRVIDLERWWPKPSGSMKLGFSSLSSKSCVQRWTRLTMRKLGLSNGKVLDTRGIGLYWNLCFIVFWFWFVMDK